MTQPHPGRKKKATLLFSSTTSLNCTDLYAHKEEYVLDNCSQQSEKLLLGDKQIFVRLFCSCVQPDFPYTTCYMLCCRDFFYFFSRKGKLIAKRAENLFSYWLGAECQDGGGQLWGKAGRPAAFCLSHA